MQVVWENFMRMVWKCGRAFCFLRIREVYHPEFYVIRFAGGIWRARFPDKKKYSDRYNTIDQPFLKIYTVSPLLRFYTPNLK